MKTYSQLYSEAAEMLFDNHQRPSYTSPYGCCNVLFIQAWKEAGNSFDELDCFTKNLFIAYFNPPHRAVLDYYWEYPATAERVTALLLMAEICKEDGI